MSEIPHANYNKSISWSLDRIDSFQKEKAFNIVSEKSIFKSGIATIKKDNGETFICKIVTEKPRNLSEKYNENKDVWDKINLNNSGTDYVIPKNTIRNLSYTLTSPQVTTMKLTQFQTENFTKEDSFHYRLIIPITSKIDLSLIESDYVKVDDISMACGISIINLEDYELHFYKYEKGKKKYLIIDGISKMSFGQFKSTADSIILSYGFVSGNLFLDEYYYIQFDDNFTEIPKNIKYEQNEKSVITNQPLLDPFLFNQYLKAINKEEILEKYPDRIPSKVFSTMVLKNFENKTFARCSKFFIEGNQSNQRLLKAGIYSITLETMTNIICTENEEKVKPIPDEKLAKSIQDSFYEVLDDFSEKLSEYGLGILKSKINDINRPTNSKKLTAPFKLYNIELTKDDVEILNYRNKFLHGTSPFPENELEDKHKEVSYITARFRFLLNCLILKYVGYSGHIINNPAWIQKK